MDDLRNDGGLSEPNFNTEAGVRAERVVLLDEADSEVMTVVSGKNRSGLYTSLTANPASAKKITLIALAAVVLIAGVIAAVIYNNSNRPSPASTQVEAAASQTEEPVETEVPTERVERPSRNQKSNSGEQIREQPQPRKEIRNLPDENREDTDKEAAKDYEKVRKEAEKEYEKGRKEAEKQVEKARKEAEKKFDKAREQVEKMFKGEGGGKDKKADNK